MQEIKKRRIVLASVLKPVDEPRLFERMGRSLANNGFEVFIIGSMPASKEKEKDIQFISHDKIKRISLKRLTVRFAILKKILALKPECLVIATHELIGVALLYKMTTGRKIIYDVQENYYRNILYTNAFPKRIRWIVGFMVRLKETIASIFFDQFLLAEKCFERELKFTKGRSVVIENKCKLPPDFVRTPADNFEIIFTGTLDESTGVFQAMELVKKLNAINSKVGLKIVGYCAQPKTLEQIENEISNCNFMSLIGGKKFVSHVTIFEAISTAHFGIICYPDSPHTRDRIPSKLYEYLACQLPILLQNNSSWIKLANRYQAGIKVDFESIDVNSILNAMTTKPFYATKPMEALWESEEIKLIETLTFFSSAE